MRDDLTYILEGEGTFAFLTIFRLVDAVDAIPAEDLPLFLNTRAVLKNYKDGEPHDDPDVWLQFVCRRIKLGGDKIFGEVFGGPDRE